MGVTSVRLVDRQHGSGHSAAGREQRCRLLADALLAPLVEGPEEVPAGDVAPEIRQTIAAALGPRLPYVATAVATGTLGADALFVLCEVMQRVQTLGDPSVSAEVEQLLVREACRMSLRELAEMAAESLVHLGDPAPEPTTGQTPDEIRTEPVSTTADRAPSISPEPEHGTRVRSESRPASDHRAGDTPSARPDPGSRFPREVRQDPDIEPSLLEASLIELLVDQPSLVEAMDDAATVLESATTAVVAPARPAASTDVRIQLRGAAPGVRRRGRPGHHPARRPRGAKRSTPTLVTPLPAPGRRTRRGHVPFRCRSRAPPMRRHSLLQQVTSTSRCHQAVAVRLLLDAHR